MLGVHGQIAGVWTAETHWHAETLGGAERDVGADLTRRGDQRQREQVGADRDQRAAFVGGGDEVGPVHQATAGTG